MALSLCSTKTLLFFFIISAIPIAYIMSIELAIAMAKPATHVYQYHSPSFLCETAKWDDVGRRFLVSFLDGGVGQVLVRDEYSPGTVLEEVKLVKEDDVAGNATMGIAVDRPRNRLLVAFTDVLGNKYSALAACDLSTWKRLFLTQLSGKSEVKSTADDIAVDAEGNAYVTDVVSSKIWKVGVEGQLLSIIRSPLFTAKEWYKNVFGLNGIVYHPDGFLIVIHMCSGNLFKIDIRKEEEEVKLIELRGGSSLSLGDGLALLSPTKLVVAGNPYPSARLVESSDGWETASVVAKFNGPTHRVATAATVKDGRVYLSHLLGLGFPNTKKKHLLVEAVF